MVDIKRYNRLKDQGLAKVISQGPGLYSVRFSRFDVENGQELEPEIQPLSMEELLTVRATLESQVQAINEIIAQMVTA